MGSLMRLFGIIFLAFAIIGIKIFRMMEPLMPPDTRIWKKKEKQLLKWAKTKGIIGARRSGTKRGGAKHSR
jgi:hypothetical protein